MHFWWNNPMILIHQSKSFRPVIVSYSCSRLTITCKNEAYSLPQTAIVIHFANKDTIWEAESWPWVCVCLLLLASLWWGLCCTQLASSVHQTWQSLCNSIQHWVVQREIPKPQNRSFPIGLLFSKWFILGGILLTFGDFLLGDVLKSLDMYMTI